MPHSCTPTDSITDPAELVRVVRRSVHRACPRSLADHADDIAQATLLRLLGRCEASPELVLTRRYAARAARNAVIDELRAHHRHGLRRDAQRARARVVTEPDEVEVELTTGRLAAELARLPAPRRRALELYSTGHRHREIAVELGWSLKRVDNTLRRTMARIRERIELE